MYSTVANVRKEAGDPHPEDVTDDEIIKKILAADAVITNSTQHVWDGTEASMPLVEEISELLSSSFIMDKFDDPKDEAEKNFDKGMMLLQLLVSEDEVSTDVNVATSDYKTAPLNPDGATGSNRLRLNQVDPDSEFSQDF